jgi:hypothetical protein
LKELRDGGFTKDSLVYFRTLSGGGSPFMELFDYNGSEAPSDEAIYLVDPESPMALSLSPLMFRRGGSSASGTDESDVFLFDKIAGDVVTFRAVHGRAPLEIGPNGALEEPVL